MVQWLILVLLADIHHRRRSLSPRTSHLILCVCGLVVHVLSPFSEYDRCFESQAGVQKRVRVKTTGISKVLRAAADAVQLIGYSWSGPTTDRVQLIGYYSCSGTVDRVLQLDRYSWSGITAGRVLQLTGYSWSGWRLLCTDHNKQRNSWLQWLLR